MQTLSANFTRRLCFPATIDRAMSRKQKTSLLCPLLLPEQIQAACLEISLSVASLGQGLMALGLECSPGLGTWQRNLWEEGRESWCPQDSAEGNNMEKRIAKVL